MLFAEPCQQALLTLISLWMSRCISFSAGGGSFITPCEYERRAGITAVKKTIRYKGTPIGNFLHCSIGAGDKKFCFAKTT